jgi:hypothetical protein
METMNNPSRVASPQQEGQWKMNALSAFRRVEAAEVTTPGGIPGDELCPLETGRVL